MKSLYLSLLLLFSLSFAYAQQAAISKKIKAIRTSTAPKINGILDDPEWQNVPVATGFIENNPTPGRVEPATQSTEVKIIYDDHAVYLAARMYGNPDSIARELMTRDQIGNAAFFGVFFDPYLDRINGNGFIVTAAGSQFDAKYSQIGDEDENWNAVWESEARIDDQGWTMEMRIPYSALRFSSKEIQNWGINFMRKRAMVNSQTF